MNSRLALLMACSFSWLVNAAHAADWQSFQRNGEVKE
jgi:hypothetical protein